MTKEERIKRVAETAQKALYAFSDTANDELQALHDSQLIQAILAIYAWIQASKAPSTNRTC